jgi:hypothetical protein
VLGAYGWRGDGSDIDGISPTSGGGFAKIVEGIDGDTPEARESRRTAVAGFLAGLGYSIQSHSHDYPSIREVAVRAISRDQAGAEAEAEFRKNYEHLVVDNPNENTSPLALSRAEFQVALAQAVANAKAPVAYYDARTMRITAIVDNLMSPDAQEAAYQQGGMSAPSMMHTGYHEAVHAAHAAAVSEAAGIRTSGGPLSDKEIEKFLKAREGKILGVMKDMLKNPERWKISKGAASMTQSEMQDYVVKAIVRSSSFYGASNPNETIAEYATAVALGGAEPNEAMDELYEAFTGMRPPAPPKHLTPMTVDQRKNRNARVESVVGPPPILTFGPGEP